MEEMLERLTAEIKNELDITWEDPGTDKKVLGWVMAGMNYLNDKAGQKLEYEFGSQEWSLLVSYSRYARDASLDVFEPNFQRDILALQNNCMINRKNPPPPAGAPPFAKGGLEVDDEESAVSTGQ